MRVQRLTLKEFKRFAGEWTIDGLEPGLNVLVGPNEAGKSTVATALRAVFLERHKTSAGAIADFAPTGVGQARPTVEVTFTAQDTDYRLTKTFLHRQRCELIAGEQRYEGDLAEQHLASLLGFDLHKTGMSKPAHAGVPGLLWMTQGTGHDVAQPALHAGGHLRSALTALSGELAATDGDRLLNHVAAASASLLDARLGKPKGAYREAEQALAQAREHSAELRAARTAWERDVDAWTALRREHAADAQAQPWLVFERQAEEARLALSRVADYTEQAARAEAAAQHARQACDLLAQQIARDETDAEALAALTRQHALAEQAIADAREQVQRTEQAHRKAQDEASLAVATLAQARAYAAYGQRQLRREAAQRASAALDDTLAQARAKADQVDALRAQASGSRIPASELARLREESVQLQGMQARAHALATRLTYDLTQPGQLRVAGTAVQGQGSFSLTTKTLIEIAGLGTLTVAPGGGDAAQLQSEWMLRDAAHRQALAQWGAASLAQLETQFSEAEYRANELKFALDALVLHAPHGIEALAARAEEARREMLALADDPSVVVPEPTRLSLAAAESAEAAARAALDYSRDRWHEAQSMCESSIARTHVLSEQRTARHHSVHGETAMAERAARSSQLAPARQTAERLQGDAQAARAAVEALRPDVLAQDAQRWARSAKVAREEHDARVGQIRQLQGRIEQGGAQGIGEALAQAEAVEQRLARRVDDYAQHAAALDLLWQRLSAHRDQTTRRLFAPLAERLNHYLNLLFPQAGLVLDDDLTPRSLTRAGQPDAVPTLSFGTQEQLGVLTRLAYADVLAEAGRPVLLVLDDALVHTDDARREQMKRALFDAASRHQILMLTCHADAWRDMGVVQRLL